MKEWFELHKSKVLLVMLLLTSFIIYLYSTLNKKVEIKKEVGNSSIIMEQTEIENNQKKVTTNMMVDIKGAVNAPGVYLALEQERVIDLINKAGGFSKEADTNQVNLSQHIEDEMVIFVPTKGELNDQKSIYPGSHESTLLNINNATESELQSLPGIGSQRALAIIEYRETNGKFKEIEDLKEISGIGEKTFEKLAPLISVN